MRKIRIHQLLHIWIQCIGLLLVSMLVGCTLHEEPELTAGGELGVDPTEVTLKANLKLDITRKERTSVGENEEESYLHRFIVEAYLNRQVVARQVFYENVTGQTHIILPVKMKLHARNYQLVVWSDYVKESTSGSDWFYDTETLVPLVKNGSYQGNSEYKNSFASTTSVDLSAYREQWGAEVTADIPLYSPLARYELVANDVKEFLEKVTNGEISGKKFTVRVKYSYYLPVGYNVLDDVPKFSLMYMQYVRSFELPEEGVEELALAFDYVFVAKNEKESIPVEVEIVDENNVTVNNTVLHIPCERGKNTTLKRGFLTTSSEGGIGFDPDYDGEIDVDVPV